MDLAFQQLQGLWQRPLAAARRAPHLTDGYGVVIALTANECAICATSSGGSSPVSPVFPERLGVRAVSFALHARRFDPRLA
jgi:hypothetical protein